jgi:voltage-gated potassium channel
MSTLNENNNFIYLTASLVALLLFSALIDTLPQSSSHLILEAAVVATFAVGYLSLSFGLAWNRFVRFLLIALVASSVLHELGLWAYASFMNLLLMFLFFAGAAYHSSLQVLFSGRVDSNIIVGSIAIFLLLGLIWATLYLIAMEFSSGAFNGMPAKNWVENFPVACYFSFVTLTTLGYGEISPAQPFSRVLVYLEAITGVFYMTVVVASLVGARTSPKKN